jgi:integrase
MRAAWPTVTCTACRTTGPGRREPGLCRRCYARQVHTPRVCGGCNQLRRHLAAGLCARCYRLSRTRHVRCPACDQVRPIHFGDRCERCKRRAAARAGACRSCGRHVQRLWSGRCRSCDQRARETVGACTDCLCWTFLLSGRCRPCRLFRWGHQPGRCPSCGRHLPLGASGRCRLCQATSRATGTRPDAASGIQLFLLVGTPADRRPPQPPRLARMPPVGLGQLRLTRAGAAPRRVPTARVSSAWPRLAQRLRDPAHRELLATLTSHGQARGWSEATLQRTRRSLAILFGSGAALDLEAPLEAATVRQFLVERHLTALRVVEFLADQGLVHVDDQAVLDGWLTRRLQPLPDPIRAEVHAWVQALRGRGARAGRPRKRTTIQGYLRALQPALADWSARYQSLRQVTGDDVTAQLGPVTGPTRLLVLAAMRSLFAALKARRLLFANPTTGLLGRRATPTPVLGLDPARRAGLLTRLDRPDERLVVLLAGVHALRSAQICALTLDAVDLAAGTLLVDGRTRRLDALTLQQLHAWLGLRRRRWPATANPYLLVNQSTAGGLAPVTRGFVQAALQHVGTTAHQLRVDRLLAEVHATDGDPLKLVQLFGVSDPTAIHYCAQLGSLDHELDRTH